MIVNLKDLNHQSNDRGPRTIHPIGNHGDHRRVIVLISSTCFCDRFVSVWNMSKERSSPTHTTTHHKQPTEDPEMTSTWKASRQRIASRVLFLLLIVNTSTTTTTTTAMALDVLRGQMILAPLTRGGNVPFRRLCHDLGCRAAVGEMIFARHLLRGDPVEQARLRRSSHEDALFGVQIATNDAAEGAAAMAAAAAAGADFVDLNTGCPLYEATRRGLGSALLRNPARLGILVHDMIQRQSSSAGNEIPLTVKVRLGCERDTCNVRQVAAAVRDAGAAALTIHGRTAQQGYKQSADWEWTAKVVQDNINNNNHQNSGNNHMPIIGNGDILTHYEARRRMETSGVDAVMVGRGALIKPWIFQEFAESRAWDPDALDRIAIYRRLACYMKEYFGDDAMGRKSAWNFLPWHFDFFARYVPFPEAEYGNADQALIQTRVTPSCLTPIDELLCNRHAETHDIMASILWESDSDANAVTKLAAFAESPDFAQIQRRRTDTADDETKELSNIPKNGEQGKREKRRERTPKPKRTPEEIAAIRVERAAKREATGSTYAHVDGARRESNIDSL